MGVHTRMYVTLELSSRGSLALHAGRDGQRGAWVLCAQVEGHTARCQIEPCTCGLGSGVHIHANIYIYVYIHLYICICGIVLSICIYT